MALEVSIQTDQLLSELHQLAAFSDPAEPNVPAPPAVTRLAFTEADRQARDYLRSLYEAAGLTLRVDPIGNTFARWCPPSANPDLPGVGTGSHGDTPPRTGMYDGSLGVLGGLEAIRALQRADYQPQRPVEVVVFTGEDSTRFGVGSIGSRALIGALAPEDLARLADIGPEDGDDYDAVRQAAGFTGDLADIKLPDGHYHAWVELHIEQGPKLEKQNAPIGIVMGIAAPAAYVFHVTGEGGHAGGVTMPERRDALCAAAETIHAIEQLARSSPSPDLVATVGQLELSPAATNAIPSKVRFTLDLRDIDADNRDLIAAAIREECNTIGLRRDVKITRETLHADPPAACDKTVIDAIEKACDDADLRWWKMISPRYHDSLFMAQHAPTGMILIPCRDGGEHRPGDVCSPAEIAAGVEVLALTLAELAGS